MVVIHPASQGLQAVHQPLGEASEIRLPVAEFEMVDGRQQGLFVKTLFYYSGKRLPDCGLELLLLRQGGALCHHAEVGLL